MLRPWRTLDQRVLCFNQNLEYLIEMLQSIRNEYSEVKVNEIFNGFQLENLKLIALIGKALQISTREYEAFNCQVYYRAAQLKQHFFYNE